MRRAILKRSAKFAVDAAMSSADRLVIRDVGPWEHFPTVTNDAEGVVRELRGMDMLPKGRRLLYFDSLGSPAEIAVSSDGVFVGFLPWDGR